MSNTCQQASHVSTCLKCKKFLNMRVPRATCETPSEALPYEYTSICYLMKLLGSVYESYQIHLNLSFLLVLLLSVGNL